MGLSVLAETRDVINERKEEIERQLKFIKEAIETKSDEIEFVTQRRDQESNIRLSFDKGLIKTLSASTYLLLYNLIECAMTNAIDAIHAHIRKEGISFHDLSKQMQKIALKNFRNALDQEDSILSQQSIEHAIVWLGYDDKKLFSGNIDARKITQMANKYGFSISDETMKKSHGGRNLLMIKSKRNELAHGKISFEECGQETSIDELYLLHNQSINFINGILDSIESYLELKQYLKTQT